MSDIQIYVACLAAYNSGFLHGNGLIATLDEDTIKDEIKGILGSSPVDGAEEWAIHDHEGFEPLYISEYSGLDDICEKAGIYQGIW